MFSYQQTTILETNFCFFNMLHVSNENYFYDDFPKYNS